MPFEQLRFSVCSQDCPSQYNPAQLFTARTTPFYPAIASCIFFFYYYLSIYLYHLTLLDYQPPTLLLLYPRPSFRPSFLPSVPPSTSSTKPISTKSKSLSPSPLLSKSRSKSLPCSLWRSALPPTYLSIYRPLEIARGPHSRSRSLPSPVSTHTPADTRTWVRDRDIHMHKVILK